jgi:penicillin-binding protein 2
MNNPDHPLIDLATAGQFPPGSTFKLITGTAALQTGVVNVDTYIDDTGSINLGVRTFYGWKAGGLGPMNIVSAISHSSDIYMYTVAGGNPVTNWGPGIGAERLAAYARMFGLGQKTGIQLPDEMPGFVPSPSWYNSLKPGSTPIRPAADYTWHIGDTYNMAIGQGYNLETPLQMVNVAATIANGGTVYQPQILEKIVGRVVPRVGVSHQNQTIQPFVPAILRRNFISPGNLALIQQGMHEAVTLPNWQGTGYLVQDPRVDAAGKTGTAEVGDLPPHAWWVGYAPFNNPQVAISVLVPNAGGEGAYVAAPIAHKILEDYFHLPAAKPKTPGPCGCWLDDVQQVLVGNTGGSQ